MEPYVTTAGASRRLAIDPDCQEDPFYRYQTHQLVVDFHGKQARLVNLDLVAKNLQTSADYIATFLATSLNAAVKRSPAAQKQGGHGGGAAPWVLYPATFTVEKMNLCFRAFLTSVVLCPSCSLPELINLVEPHRASSPPRVGDESPLSASLASEEPKRKGRKGMKGSGGGTKVSVRCQGCGWNEPLERSMRRVKNTKFVDYVLAHPPQQTSATLLE
jgi:hypothetical protein